MSKKCPTKKTIKKDTKKLSKNAKIWIIVVVCIVFLGLAIGLPIGLTKNTNIVLTPSPSYVDFNQQTDYMLRVKWNKINGAKGYTYQYCYGEPTEKDSVISVENFTQNTTTSFERHKGVVAFRVKSVFDDKNTEYSQWIKFEVDEWVLAKPIVTITSDLSTGWTKNTFKYFDVSYNVPAYECNFSVEDVWISKNDLTVSTNSINMRDFLINYLSNPSEENVQLFNKISAYRTGSDWENITIKVRVRAINVQSGITAPATSEFIALKNMYANSEYAFAELIITEEIYKNLTK